VWAANAEVVSESQRRAHHAGRPRRPLRAQPWWIETQDPGSDKREDGL
jgi:hypothetical protein